MRVIGMFRRFSNSLFMHWRGRQDKPKQKTTADFFTAMNAEHHRRALRCLSARNPSFKKLFVNWPWFLAEADDFHLRNFQRSSLMFQFQSNDGNKGTILREVEIQQED